MGDTAQRMKNIVYVELLEEGTPCWRPVEAENEGGNTYRLLGPLPEGEAWAFQPGERVLCKEHTFSSGERGLLAYARA